MALISAIVCTRNRAQYLRKAITSLVNQSLPEKQYEIIIVDNASADETREVITGFQKHYSNIIYSYEPILGISRSRNRGIENAGGKYVSFMDDDAIASPEWLSETLKGFEATLPAPACVGGKVLPIWEIEKPGWFPDQFLSSLSILDKGDTARFLNGEEIVVGTNMSYDKLKLLDIGGFNPDLLLYSDEVYVQDKIKGRGWARYYQPTASVKHVVPKERLTRAYICKRKYLGARGELITILGRKNSINRRLVFILSNLIHRPFRFLYHYLRFTLARQKNTHKEATLHKVQAWKNLGFWIQSWQVLFQQIRPRSNTS